MRDEYVWKTFGRGIIQRRRKRFVRIIWKKRARRVHIGRGDRRAWLVHKTVFGACPGRKKRTVQ